MSLAINGTVLKSNDPGVIYNYVGGDLSGKGPKNKRILPPKNTPKTPPIYDNPKNKISPVMLVGIGVLFYFAVIR